MFCLFFLLFFRRSPRPTGPWPWAWASLWMRTSAAPGPGNVQRRAARSSRRPCRPAAPHVWEPNGEGVRVVLPFAQPEKKMCSLKKKPTYTHDASVPRREPWNGGIPLIFRFGACTGALGRGGYSVQRRMRAVVQTNLYVTSQKRQSVFTCLSTSFLHSRTINIS